MDDAGLKHLKGVLEAVLFVSEKPVTLDQFKEVLETVETTDIREMIMALQNEYTDRQSGIHIIEIAGGYQMLTNTAYAEYLKKFYHSRHKEKLSKPSLETLAIIAYKQPVSRQDIEVIRGVNSDGVVNHLLNKSLIKIAGRKDVPGRPYVYGTTKQFLEYFGLRSLTDLPKIEEFSSLQPAEANIIEDNAQAEPSETGDKTSMSSQDGGQNAASPQGEEQNEESSAQSNTPAV